jgi:hypothetical protein
MCEWLNFQIIARFGLFGNAAIPEKVARQHPFAWQNGWENAVFAALAKYSRACAPGCAAIRETALTMEILFPRH